MRIISQARVRENKKEYIEIAQYYSKLSKVSLSE